MEVGDETFVKYMTCSKDGTFRVWSSQTNRWEFTRIASHRLDGAWPGLRSTHVSFHATVLQWYISQCLGSM